MGSIEGLKLMLSVLPLTPTEFDIVLFDCIEGVERGWKFETVDDIKKYFADCENQYCFCVYPLPEYKELYLSTLNKLSESLQFDIIYKNCNLYNQ